MTVNLNDTVADLLLDRLANDDGFRDLFVADPAAALGVLGPEAETFVAAARCMQVTQLADKATIAAARDSLRAMLTSELAAHNIPDLQVGDPLPKSLSMAA